MMRFAAIRASLLEPGEIVADNFAGGGGTSEGLESALGMPVTIACNHDPLAIAMYQANHPETKCFCENIHKLVPREATGGRRVGMAWFSPDCTHHSRARGGKPRDTGRRGLAWVIIRWAHDVRPRIICVENVEEFEEWGPLRPDGTPDKTKAGATFRLWVNQLRGLGYDVEWRSLVAADFGAPTTRRRFFLVARCDGRPIIWPEPTHGPGRPLPWRTAAEIIDWSIPCPSIFGRRKPLAEATQRRIAEGLRRYVFEAAEPFIVNVVHAGAPGYVYSAREPLRTVVTQQEFAVVAPTLVQTGYGERPGQRPRALDLAKPLGTVVGGQKHGLVAAFLAKHYGGVVGHGVERPIGAVTSKDHHSVAAAFLAKFYGTSTAAPVEAPLPTVTSGGGHGGGHLAEVRAFLLKFYGTGGQWQGANEPLHTVTSRARFGLVMVAGEPYQVVDIGLRMLQPAELFRAQSFPDDYVIDLVGPRGKPLTKAEQTHLAGNAVPPVVAEALAGANVTGDASFLARRAA